MTIKKTILQDSGFKTYNDLIGWEKSYVFLRILIDTNRFGALAKDKKRLISLKDNLLTTYKFLSEKDDDEKTKCGILHNVLKQTLLEKTKENSNKQKSYHYLNTQLAELLNSPKDFFVLSIAIQEFLIPTNSAIERVPTVEATEFARIYGKALLDEKKEQALSTLIRDWDLFTEALSLNKERDIIVELISNIKKRLKNELTTFGQTIEERDDTVIISAVCQEFERRVGQKRKQRAGSDLESVTEFIFNYFNIKTAGGPEHFTSGLEVDNWIKDNNGWFIGISLKRTLRERWKQTYTTDLSILDRHRIKFIIHIINNDSDLSDSKISELGSYRHIFFLADQSNVFQEFKDHVAMGKYLFPMSKLIEKINSLIKK